MGFNLLIDIVTDKQQFKSIESYFAFCQNYLEYIDKNLQARIVSQNESHYHFLQYNKDGNYAITRPINTKLMFDADGFNKSHKQFLDIINQLRDRQAPDNSLRDIVTRTIYTAQQAIGATLDGLPTGKSNQARKINGDLFERLIFLMFNSVGINCSSGIIKIPVKDHVGNELLKASYQHDLIIKKDNKTKVIGSVKTSSKDRLDKVFMDKFMLNKLTNVDVPHIAIFLNDVQRKKAKEGYGVGSTFLTGHFKAYTVKLNPLDGVYYCDERLNMKNDEFLA